jgi:predicted secreted protein
MRTSFTSFAFAAFLAACGSGHEATPLTMSVTIDDSANGKTVSAVANEAVVIKLIDHGDGGLAWGVTSDGGLGAPVETHLAGSGTPGDFGTDVFTFDTSKASPGSHTIVLTDARPDGSMATTYSVTIVVIGSVPDAGPTNTAGPTTTTPPDNTGPTEQPIVIDDSQNGTTVNVPAGDQIVVRLGSLGDGGYQWSFVSAGSLGTPVQTHELPANPTPGDFGYDVFTFDTNGIAAGNYTIKLVNERLFDSSTAMSWSVDVALQ